MNLISSEIIYSARFLISIILFSIINFILIKLFIKYSFSLNLLDIPNNRSSHIKATPKGAGIVFSLTSILFIILIFKSYYILILLPLLIIGFIDDYKPISASTRYLVQLFSSFVIVYNSNLFQNLSSSNYALVNLLIFATLVIASTAIINFFNFSDGIDGLVASSALIYFIFIGILLNPLFLVIASSLFIFLIFNWFPAKVFMGDVGSTFIGSLVAIASFTQLGYLNSLTMLLMIFPILMDPFVCIFRRLLAKQNIFKAHKSHLYQRLHQNGWKHSSVSLLYSFATLISCFSFTLLDFSYGIVSLVTIFLIGIYFDYFYAASFDSTL